MTNYPKLLNDGEISRLWQLDDKTVVKVGLHNFVDNKTWQQQDNTVLKSLISEVLFYINFKQYYPNVNIIFDRNRFFGINMPLYQKLSKPDQCQAKDIIKILQDIVPILQAVHSSGWFHGDIKADNIMLDANGKYILLDWGLTGLARRDKHWLDTCSAINYRAMEYLESDTRSRRNFIQSLHAQEQRFTCTTCNSQNSCQQDCANVLDYRAGDVWALAIFILIHFFDACRLPSSTEADDSVGFSAQADEYQQFNNVINLLNNGLEELLKQCPDNDVKYLLQRMLQPKAAERLTINQIYDYMSINMGISFTKEKLADWNNLESSAQQWHKQEIIWRKACENTADEQIINLLQANNIFSYIIELTHGCYSDDTLERLGNIVNKLPELLSLCQYKICYFP